MRYPVFMRRPHTGRALGKLNPVNLLTFPPEQTAKDSTGADRGVMFEKLRAHPVRTAFNTCIAGVTAWFIFILVDTAMHLTRIDGLTSSLTGVTFPAGSVGSSDDSGEFWRIPLGLTNAEDFLRSRLPMNEPLNGLPYCGEKHHSVSLEFSWAAPSDGDQPARRIDVNISRTDNRFLSSLKNSDVAIYQSAFPC
jgi:hypothetical protein